MTFHDQRLSHLVLLVTLAALAGEATLTTLGLTHPC